MSNEINQTSTDGKPNPDGTGAFSTEDLEKTKKEFERKPKPPFLALFIIPENSVLCSICGLPGGKLNFVDSLGRPWTIKINTNLSKWTDGSWIHQNRDVCTAGKNIRLAPANKDGDLKKD